MAYYRLSKVVKMRRLALGVKREEFDTDGPTGMTVYRMEEGKHKTSERTYRSLTRSMGIEESTYQGILKTKKLDELQMTYEMREAFLNADAEEAERVLMKMRERLDETDQRNQQYLMVREARIRYNRGEIAAEEYERILKELLKYRVPKAYKVDMKFWPLHVEECQIVFGINNVLRLEKKYEEQENLALCLQGLLEWGYMNYGDSHGYQIVSSIWHADMLGNVGKHREAIALDEKTLGLCEEAEEYRYLEDVYYDIFWNYWMLRKRETLSVAEEERCRQCLVKAYYIDKIRGGFHPRYEQRLKECYPEEL